MCRQVSGKKYNPVKFFYKHFFKEEFNGKGTASVDMSNLNSLLY